MSIDGFGLSVSLVKRWMRWLLQGHALGCWLLLMTTAVYRPVSAFVRAQASQASRGYLHRLQVLPRRDYLFTAAVATTLSVGGIERPDRLADTVFPPIQSRRRSSTMTSQDFPYRLIDSHLHVWSDGDVPYRYAEGQFAPPGLQDLGTAERLLGLMDQSGVEKALIVQPIIYLYDHSYVKSIMDKYPTRFMGMLNANPTLGPQEAVQAIRSLHAQGFKSIRFNPYIWPTGEKMDNAVGRAMYAEAGKLGMPVGFMCFKGLNLHEPEILSLLRDYPETPVIIDHFGFFHQEKKDIEEAWKVLLQLAKFPQVTVKIAAFFRVSSEEWPFSSLAGRLDELVRVYGSNRLMWGSDFPYVQTMGGGYVEAPRAVLNWHKQGLLPSMQSQDFENLFAGTVLRVLSE